MVEKQTTQLNYSGPAPDAKVEGGGFFADMFHSDLDQIKKWIDNTNPDSVRRAGQYYVAGKGVLDEAARQLKAKATELAELMKGPAAVETQKGLQSLHASMRELGAKLGEMGVPLTEYADTLNWAQANLVDSRYRHSRSDQGFEVSDFVPFAGITWSEDRARDHLEAVNKKIVEHYQKLPAEVQQALPSVTPVNMPDFRPGGTTDYTGGLPSNYGSPYDPNGSGTGGFAPSYGVNPNGAYPNGVDPNDVDSNDLNPNDLNPNDVDPNDLDPNGVDPNGAYPNGVDPNGAYPNGVNPNGAYPNGVNPNGAYPNGVNPNGAYPNGVNPNGLDPSKTGLSLPDPNNTQLAGLNDQAMSRLSSPDLPTSTWPNSTGYQGSGNNTSGHGASGIIGGHSPGGGGAVNADTSSAGSRTAANTGMSGMVPPPVGGASAPNQEEDTQSSAYWIPEPDEYWTGPPKNVTSSHIA
ncbi:WXG100 family type VII secretion target [Streptosporangium roseum]|uniref:WXG100 family type VII secretion target n=1 Tax=Streptosporangium roseum TaxID=2001 RepID=UPI00331F48B3